MDGRPSLSLYISRFPSEKETCTMARADAETANSGQEAAILTSEVVEFLHLLQASFALCRQELLIERDRRQRRYDLDQAPHSLPKIEHSGESDWAVKPSLSDQ